MSGYKPLILIVDDEQKNIQVLGTVLINSGYNVITAVNGQQALEKLEKSSPDLIMLDVMMPVMDGMTTCEKIKSCERTKDIPVIFLTARIEKDDVIEGLRKGAVDYIAKPFNQEELLCRVATHIELVMSKKMLAEQVKASNELLHIICHDIVNPVGSIGNILTLVDAAEPLGHFKPMLEESVARCLNVVDLVRQMRAVDSGKLSIEPERVSLAEAVAVAVDMLAAKLKNKNIQAVAEISPEHFVMAEKVSLVNSVLGNLLTNAIKFSEKNSVIRISSKEDSGFVTAEVRDFGIGIPEKLLNVVFDPSKATTRAGTEGESGTGFGLPLVKKFVEAYGGSVDIFSSETADRGTAVRLNLLKA